MSITGISSLICIFNLNSNMYNFISFPGCTNWFSCTNLDNKIRFYQLFILIIKEKYKYKYNKVQMTVGIKKGID